MPTSTFLRLPTAKKQKIIQAAMEEYSRVPHNEVSIKNIVTAAGIPRGSFYAYFDDREDLANFLLQDYREKVNQNIREIFKKTQGDLFQSMLILHDSILQYMEKRGYLRMTFRNLHACIDRDLLDNVADQDRATHLTDTMREMINPKNLQVRDERELYDILEIMVMLLRNSIAKSVANNLDYKTACEIFRNRIKILERGMRKPK